jgi:cell surface protein SprA
MGIFGKPEININVNGEVNLRMGWRWDAQNLGSASAFGKIQSSPIFSQDIRVNVSGGIGDKLKIGTDWNTRQTFNKNNTFKIGFDGYDDDIIKKVEFGNVTLPLPTTLIKGGQTLFGVRGDFQFGPLYLKTILSQKKGERKFIEIKGGVSKQPFSIRAYDYAQNHFFLDTAYKSIYKKYYKNSTGIIPNEALPLAVKEIEVYESTNLTTDVSVAEAIAYAELPPLNSTSSYPDSYKRVAIENGKIESGRFIRLDSTKYKIDRNLGHLIITNLKKDRTYAVAYRTENIGIGTEADDEYHGTLSYRARKVDLKDTLVLKLIYRPNLQPGFKTLWSRQMKNIYSLNASGANLNETKIGIWYIRQNNDSTDILDGSADKVVTILGVDKVTSSGEAKPDGQFDMNVGSPFFDPQRGEITFPTIEPFREGLREYFASKGTASLAESYVFNEIYDTTDIVAKRNTARDRFVISGEISAANRSAGGRIPLGAYNLQPGSVRVLLNNVQLKEYTDYMIDYFSGTLQLKNDQASLPGANLRVEYEQQDIFQVATKTQVGLRADYRVYKSRSAEANLGFTFMHYNQSAVVDRVTLGQEPVANTMFGFDAKINMDAPWITKALDFLPFYDTKAPSNITLGGEWAMILPNPNKRTSTIASDNNEPVVFIDDFEGAQRYINLGLNPTMWQHSSQPEDFDIGPDDTTRAKYRGKMFWYKYFIPRVAINEVYPNQTTYVGKNNLSPLEIAFSPYTRGIYNTNPEFLDSLNPEFVNQADPKWTTRPENKPKIWGGMQRLLSSFNTNFDTENIEFIEIMMKIDNYEPGQTKMYVDLGQISEDIIANQRLDTEDGSTTANPLPNGRIDAGEDKGLDILDNEQEKAKYPFPLNLEKDPARDDYAFDYGKKDEDRGILDYLSYNNFEGNSGVTELGQFPDKEIMNDNNGQTISLGNSYFRYEVNLIVDPKQNPQIVGGNNGWFLYRIPIRKPSQVVGSPLFSNIQYIRVMYKGGVLNARIADWRLLGSQWQRISNFQSNVGVNDSAMSLAFVNVFENSGEPDFYSMPPGVQAPRQLNNPDPTLDVKLNEQSLSVCVNNLQYGQDRMAVRIFPRQDVFFYKKLKFFIHGDGSMPSSNIAGAVPKAYSFLRFGTDSANYYEYRRPITRDWQDIEIDLQQLTAIKQVRDTSMAMLTQRQSFNVPGDEFAQYTIKGNPILTKLQFFGIGISNPQERFPNDLSTCMWVDELRLISPEKSNDWAGIANASVKLADLGTINASFSTQQPNFHNLEERFGNRMQTGTLNVSVQGNLEKFAPTSFAGMVIPISYSHNERNETPQYVANSDVNLEQASAAAREQALKLNKSEDEANKAASEVITRSQTVRVHDSWALTGVKLGIPSKFILIDQTLNKMTFSYNYSQDFERSPMYENRFNWIWTTKVDYTNSFPEFLAFEPLTWAENIPILSTYSKWKLNLFPSNFTSSISLNRKRLTEQSRYIDYPSPVIRDFASTRTAQFNWKLSQNGLLSPTIDYTLNSVSSLAKFELDEEGRQRTASDISRQMFFKNGRIIDFGDNTQQTQTITINMKPKIPDMWGLNKYLDMTGSFNTDYQWSDPLQKDPLYRDVSKRASFNNRIRFNWALSLQALGDSWFGATKNVMFSPAQLDSLGANSIMSRLGKTLKFILLDFQKVDFTFSQTNSSVNPGTMGGTGLSNFWGRGLTFRESDDMYGPSFAYQLGLVNSPHGGFNIGSSSAFPFISFNTFDGLRPKNSIMQDNFSQKTTFEIKTSRPLWEGAKLDINWKTDVGFNKNQTVVTYDDGVPHYSNVLALQSFSRTYITLPKVFGINAFNNNIDNVINIFNKERDRINASSTDSLQKSQEMLRALSESFYKGLEAFSFTGSGSVGKFLPSMNWGIKWEGLEKLPWFDGYVKKIQIEHTYTSTYDEAVQITDKGRIIQNQQINYGFSPLIGITMNFDEKKIGGNLTASFKWNSTRGFNLSSAARAVIAEQSTDEIQAQGNYKMKGFTWNLLGLDLQNELEYIFLFTLKKNSRATFDVLDQTSTNNNEGRQLTGDTQIILEPRARYTISNRVKASAFLRYETTLTAGAAKPGFSSTQVGLDINISIAGGR